jgi:hypothetical protein
MKRLQEVPHRGRGRESVAQQRRQGPVFAERREVLAAVPAARPQRDQALHELRRPQAPLALLDADLRIDRCRCPELAEQLTHERHPGAAGDQAGINRLVNLERQPRRLLGHRVPPCCVCTQWVNASKGDATHARRAYCGSAHNRLGRSGR